MKFVIFLIAVCLLATPVTLPTWHEAHAQAKEKKKPSKPKARRSEVLSKAAFRKIEQSQNLLAEDKYVDALAPLKAIIDGKKYTPYEKAVAIQTTGFVYAGQGHYAKTRKAFERAIATGALPPRVVNDLTYNLAQLNLADGHARKALALLQKWLKMIEGEPAADTFALKAQIYLVLENLPTAEKAIRKAMSKSETPKQNWVRILLSILLQQERFGEARPILEDAVERWPGVKIFWQQLTAVYYEAGEEKLGFVAQQAMFIQNMLTTSKELSNMAQLYLYHNVPIKAAVILQRGLDKGQIEKTEKNYELMAQAYMNSREWKKAVPPLTKAAKKSKKGKHYEKLGQSYLQDEEWKKAAAAFERALKKGGLDDAANSWLLLGIARTRLKKYDEAIKALRKAGEDDAVAEDAYRWIRSIERQLAEARRADKRAKQRISALKQ